MRSTFSGQTNSPGYSEPATQKRPWGHSTAGPNIIRVEAADDRRHKSRDTPCPSESAVDRDSKRKRQRSSRVREAASRNSASRDVSVWARS